MNEQELFEKCLKQVLKWEGGYANVAGDAGGVTYKGITQNTYNSYLKSKGKAAAPIATEYAKGTVPAGKKFVYYKPKNVDIVIHISDAEIKEIYYNRYWLAAGCQKMTPKFAALCFDTAVNMGVGVVKATGMTRNTEFLKAASYTYPEKYIAAKRAKYYEFAKYGNQKKFLQGWLNRLNDMEKFIKTL